MWRLEGARLAPRSAYRPNGTAEGSARFRRPDPAGGRTRGEYSGASDFDDRWTRSTRLRRTVEEFARDGRGAQVAAEHYERDEFPYDIVAADGRDGAVRAAVPRGVRRHGRRLLRAVPGDRGAGPGRLVGGDHARGGGVARRDADLPVRHRRAEQEWLPRLCPARRSARSG